MKRSTTIFKNTLHAENFILFLKKDDILKAIQILQEQKDQQQRSSQDPNTYTASSSSNGAATRNGHAEFIPFSNEEMYGTVKDNPNRKWQKPQVKYEYMYTINETTTRTSKVYEILPKIYDDKNWPNRTNIHCWHCVHPFESTPVPIPVTYDKRTETFKVIGCFCSFNCAKTYIATRLDGPSRFKSNSLLIYMYRKVLNRHAYHKINKAPPVTALDIFGGPLSIQEFRRSCHEQISTVTQLSFPMIVINDHIEYSFSNSNNRANGSAGASVHQDKELQNRIDDVANSWSKKRQKLMDENKKTFENDYGVKVVLKKKK